MKKQSILFGVVGLIIGAFLSGLIVATIKDDDTTAKFEMGNNNSMTMEEMSGTLKGKTGDDFDKAFISGMIQHHQGAIDMANLASQYAKHGEIKQMANDIVTAQSKEINMMKSWQMQWGYDNASSSHMTH